jgi:riboflavin biosynthesis pyrimidine reductase
LIKGEFDVDAVRALKESSDRDISIGGATIAGRAIASGLVDEIHLFAVPWLIGGGTRALPSEVNLPMELVEERSFANGFVHLHYRILA